MNEPVDPNERVLPLLLERFSLEELDRLDAILVDAIGVSLFQATRAHLEQVQLMARVYLDIANRKLARLEADLGLDAVEKYANGVTE